MGNGALPDGAQDPQYDLRTTSRLSTGGCRCKTPFSTGPAQGKRLDKCWRALPVLRQAQDEREGERSGMPDGDQLAPSNSLGFRTTRSQPQPGPTYSSSGASSSS